METVNSSSLNTMHSTIRMEKEVGSIHGFMNLVYLKCSGVCVCFIFGTRTKWMRWLFPPNSLLFTQK